MQWLRQKLAIHRKREQAGQSIVLLAFAFIMLAAFVGLVTDISILFVRYSSLRRTVDAAAVAAAGQLRGETDFGTVALTAREFILLHGLEPDRVIVETCETDIANWRAGTGAWAGQPHPESVYPDVGAMGNTELCNWEDPGKLVRVTAQVESETFFLRLLGIGDVTLEATAVAEAALMDVALVLDTSQSMSNDTTLDHYTSIGYDVSGDQPTFRDGCYNPDWLLEGRPPYDADPTVDGYFEDPVFYQWGACCNDPGNGRIHQTEDGSWVVWTDRNGNDTYDPGEEGVTSSSGDGDLSDLICHPFREVKDAARNFVQRLDFEHGDRLAIITFDEIATPVRFDYQTNEDILITSENEALARLNTLVGVNANLDGGGHGRCYPLQVAFEDWNEPDPPPDGEPDNEIDNDEINPQRWRPVAYESISQCPDTNIGGGLRVANAVLTDPVMLRRDAMHIIILLSDGAANRTDPAAGATVPNYGSYGFCPWPTFCNPGPESPLHVAGIPDWSECPEWTNGLPIPGSSVPICNDNDPDTRHFCLQWSNDVGLNGRPDWSSLYCGGFGPGSVGAYDADDYARDWADYAGLSEVASGIPGNFITIFTIGYGENIPTSATSAPLLRYIADAGDNGVIDNDLQQDWRDNRVLDSSVSPEQLGNPDICQNIADPAESCGQYFYANDLASLDAVFEQISNHLFTRITR